MNESDIVRQIIRWIKEQGGDAWKIHGSELQRAGEPDIDGWLPGKLHLKLEVKTAIGKPSQIQLLRLQRYKDAGYVAGVVRSVEETKQLVADYINALGTPEGGKD